MAKTAELKLVKFGPSTRNGVKITEAVYKLLHYGKKTTLSLIITFSWYGEENPRDVRFEIDFGHVEFSDLSESMLKLSQWLGRAGEAAIILENMSKEISEKNLIHLGDTISFDS